MNSIKLTYFDAKGAAETSRIAFRYGNIDFEDVRLNREQWMELKQSEKTVFGQLPMLEVDGKVLAQSTAIARYAGKMVNLYPSNPVDALVVDMIMDSQKDIISKLTPSFYEKDEEKKKSMREEVKHNVYPRFLKAWETMFHMSGGDWIIGNTMTIADISLFTMFQGLPQLDYIGIDILDEYPSLRAFYEKAGKQLGPYGSVDK